MYQTWSKLESVPCPGMPLYKKLALFTCSIFIFSLLKSRVYAYFNNSNLLGLLYKKIRYISLSSFSKVTDIFRKLCLYPWAGILFFAHFRFVYCAIRHSTLKRLISYCFFSIFGNISRVSDAKNCSLIGVQIAT